MQQSVGYISFSPHFFVRIKPSMVVFGHEGLPDKIHLTISGLAHSNDINLHVTNENGAPNKPHITVAIADKTLLQHKTEAIGINWIYDQLDPVWLRLRPKRKRLGYRDRAYYIRLDDLYSNPAFDAVRQNLIRVFWENVKIERKTRLKIQPELLSALQAWAVSPATIEFFLQNLKPAFKQPVSAAEFGYWNSEEYTGVVLIIEGRLFKPKEDRSIADILATFTDELRMTSLASKYESAITTVAAASNYEDTRPFDIPVRIC